MSKITAPFRWAGSKEKLTTTLFAEFLSADAYVEPFLGSGIVLFRLLQEKKYSRYIVNDINVSIISLYKAIQSDVQTVISNLEKIRDLYNNEEDKQALFYSSRSQFNTDKSNYTLFWLLQKAGFNGLYTNY